MGESPVDQPSDWLPLQAEGAEGYRRRHPDGQPDGSILATGEPNKNGVYEVVAETDLTDITGIRLEVLARRLSCPARAGPGAATATSC